MLPRPQGFKVVQKTVLAKTFETGLQTPFRVLELLLYFVKIRINRNTICHEFLPNRKLNFQYLAKSEGYRLTLFFY
jgi:hypothetical protein